MAICRQGAILDNSQELTIVGRAVDYKSAAKRQYADMAQLAEQLICNQQVIGSSPIIGFSLKFVRVYGPLAQLVRATGS